MLASMVGMLAVTLESSFVSVLITSSLLVVGSVLLPQLSTLNINLWTKSGVASSLGYIALSLSLNVILTIAIAVRLLLIRRRFKGYIGAGTRLYSSIALMFINSAAVHAVVAFICIIALAVGSPVQIALLPVLGQLQVGHLPSPVPIRLVNLIRIQGHPLNSHCPSHHGNQCRGQRAPADDAHSFHSVLQTHHIACTQLGFRVRRVPALLSRSLCLPRVVVREICKKYCKLPRPVQNVRIHFRIHDLLYTGEQGTRARALYFID